MQVSPSQLVVEVETKENRGTCHTLELNTDLQVKGVAVTADHIALWSSKTLVVYQLITEGLGEDTRITSKTVGMFIYMYHAMWWNSSWEPHGHLVKKFPCLLWNNKVDLRVYSSPSLTSLRIL